MAKLSAEDKKNILKILSKYSVEEIAEILTEEPEEDEVEVTPKRRGRPKSTSTKKKREFENEFVDEGPKTKADKVIAEASKKLVESKENVGITKRPKIHMIEVACKNCGRKSVLPSNYPDIDRFICCVPG